MRSRWTYTYVKVISVLLFGGLLSCSTLSAEEGAFIRVIESDKNVWILVENNDRVEVTIVGNFDIGGPMSTGPIKLILRSDTGKQTEFSGVMDSKARRSKITIPPYHSYGRKFSKELLKQFFHLVPGQYDLKVLYEDNLKSSQEGKNGDLGALESRWIPIKLN